VLDNCRPSSTWSKILGERVDSSVFLFCRAEPRDEAWWKAGEVRLRQARKAGWLLYILHNLISPAHAPHSAAHCGQECGAGKPAATATMLRYDGAISEGNLTEAANVI